MTEQKAIESVVTTAQSQVGYREGDNNWNIYAASLDPLGLTYGNKQNQPWCGEFVLWCFVHCFGEDEALTMLCSPKPTSIPLCSAGAQYFKSAGRWRTEPAVGDVVFFFVGDGINHTGIVVSINGRIVSTVEGNSGDSTARRSYTIGDARIAGYGRPKWAVVENNIEACEVRLPYLQKGDKNESVKALKALLIMRGYKGGFAASNPLFGSKTRKAVIKFQQAERLEVDGIVGPMTWNSLLNGGV